MMEYPTRTPVHRTLIYQKCSRLVHLLHAHYYVAARVYDRWQENDSCAGAYVRDQKYS